MIRIILAFAAGLSCAALAQDNDLTWTIKPRTQSSLVFSTGNETTITIRPDDTVILAEGLSIDEASRQFWKAIGPMMGKVCDETK